MSNQALGSIAQRLNELQLYQHIRFHNQGSPDYERDVIEVIAMSPQLALGVEKVTIDGMCIAPEDVRNILRKYVGLSQDDLDKVRPEVDLRYILVRYLLAKTKWVQSLEVGAYHMIESGNAIIAHLTPLSTFEHLKAINLNRFNYTGQEDAHSALLHTLSNSPTLQQMQLHSLSELQLPKALPVFNHLRAVTTESPGMTKAHLQNLVKSCPQLQEFTYIVTANDRVDQPLASARAVIDALSERKETIHEINLHYNSYHCIDEQAPKGRGCDYQEIIGSLTQFVHLRRLSCGAVDLFDYPGSVDDSAHASFIQKLPESLEELEIHSPRCGDEVELKKLAKTGHQVLPALKTLTIGSLVAVRRQYVPPGVKEAFDKSHIKLIIQE